MVELLSSIKRLKPFTCFCVLNIKLNKLFYCHVSVYPSKKISGTSRYPSKKLSPRVKFCCNIKVKLKVRIHSITEMKRPFSAQFGFVKGWNQTQLENELYYEDFISPPLSKRQRMTSGDKTHLAVENDLFVGESCAKFGACSIVCR